jgi:hypothetical protein
MEGQIQPSNWFTDILQGYALVDGGYPHSINPNTHPIGYGSGYRFYETGQNIATQKVMSEKTEKEVVKVETEKNVKVEEFKHEKTFLYFQCTF